MIETHYNCILQYVKNNKEADNDWFRLQSNKEGTKWFGKCWYIQNFLRYEFEVEFDVCKNCLSLSYSVNRECFIKLNILCIYVSSIHLFIS